MASTPGIVVTSPVVASITSASRDGGLAAAEHDDPAVGQGRGGRVAAAAAGEHVEGVLAIPHELGVVEDRGRRAIARDARRAGRRQRRDVVARR